MQTIPTHGVHRAARVAQRFSPQLVTAVVSGVLAVLLLPLVAWRVATHRDSSALASPGAYAVELTRARVTWKFDTYVRLLNPTAPAAALEAAAQAMTETSAMDGTPPPLRAPAVDLVSSVPNPNGWVVLVRVYDKPTRTLDTWEWRLVVIDNRLVVAEYDKNPGGEHVPMP